MTATAHKVSNFIDYPALQDIDRKPEPSCRRVADLMDKARELKGPALLSEMVRGISDSVKRERALKGLEEVSCGGRDIYV
ncbi:MAG: hypothetical protein JXB03_09545 [Spirochaetales bacterium]|nr:hypothetical protein [Spirochaetales bacterium]